MREKGNTYIILYLLTLALFMTMSARSLDTYAASSQPEDQHISRQGSFVTLVSSDMQIDSVLPHQQVLFSLPANHNDSIYSVRLLYPEYTKIKRRQSRRYRRLFGSDSLQAAPTLTYNILRERKSTTLSAEFNPVVKQGNHLYYLSSYKAQLLSSPVTRATSATNRYASHSVLANGSWAKISVVGNGVCALTAEVCRKAGFSDISKVKIYGYGGAMVPETLTEEYLASHDDLTEVPSLLQDGMRYFYAQGTVSYSSKTSETRIRNPYSNLSYYFITESDEAPAACTEADLQAAFSADACQYHELYETDGYAWTESGRNLFDSELLKTGSNKTYNLSIPAGNTSVRLKAIITSGAGATADITLGGTKLGSITVRESTSSYTKCNVGQGTFDIASLSEYAAEDGSYTLPITISVTSGSIRLDYLLATFANAGTTSLANASIAAYSCNITNQDHHADEPVDYIIIIPTSQKLLSQAQSLALLHKQHDDMTTRIVPADELYNEFSSGTPDISAYRRYLKMFYDRAKTDADIPTHVLLFGDAKWDNRCNTLTNAYNPDDMLLCYETEDSYSTLSSYTTDDFIAILADGKTLTPYNGSDATLQMDIAVGRIPVTTEAEAKGVVDKISSYLDNPADGTWQNTVVFIGDDGDNGTHMTDNNANADNIISSKQGYDVKKIMFDAYERKSTSVGNRYPAVASLIKEYQNSGALMINYAGHGSPTLLSHESVLTLTDVNAFSNTKYPIWLAAACEVVPYDATAANIGKAFVTNSKGGAIAFYGACRTVLASRNASINKAITRYLLTPKSDGTLYTIGEAQRAAKNEIVKNRTETSDNKHQYILIGDPALRLAVPRFHAVIDNIKKVSATSDQESQTTLSANSVVTVTGHIEDASGEKEDTYSGTASLLVRDSEEDIVCRNNNQEDKAFTYTDRTSRLFQGTDSIRDGHFTITFRMPRDIHNDGLAGLMTVYATNGVIAAHGESNDFIVQGAETTSNDSIGPNVYCYLNSPTFSNGGTVGITPYLVAEVSDKDGLNVTGTSLGQNPQVIIDGKADKTYDLSDYFTFNTGSYTSGRIGFVIPEVEEGQHTLHLRVWDLLGNMTDVPLQFRVVRNMQPTISDVFVSPNPVRSDGTFYITTDMMGSEANVCVDIISTAGHVMQTIEWNTTLNGTTALSWQPTGLPQGLYLYRVRISCDGYNYASTTKKLIIGY